MKVFICKYHIGLFTSCGTRLLSPDSTYLLSWCLCMVFICKYHIYCLSSVYFQETCAFVYGKIGLKFSPNGFKMITLVRFGDQGSFFTVVAFSIATLIQDLCWKFGPKELYLSKLKLVYIQFRFMELSFLPSHCQP